VVAESVNKETITEQSVVVHNRTQNGNIVTVLKESDLNEEEINFMSLVKK
jgi:hypothetical protein